MAVAVAGVGALVEGVPVEAVGAGVVVAAPLAPHHVVVAQDALQRCGVEGVSRLAVASEVVQIKVVVVVAG